jgi:hypothetical protein
MFLRSLHMISDNYCSHNIKYLTCYFDLHPLALLISTLLINISTLIRQTLPHSNLHLAYVTSAPHTGHVVLNTVCNL